MFYANGPDGGKTVATPGGEGACPLCEETLVPKCGSIVTWHWAHQGSADCDPWAEQDSAWHRSWQALADHSNCEVVIEKLWRNEFTRHRADIVTAEGVVVELQDSGISPEEIEERESFYGDMVWIFNATEPFDEERLLIYERRGYQTFRWKHPRKSLGACRKPVLLDLGSGRPLFRLKRIHTDAPCGGWGFQVDRSEIVSWISKPAETFAGPGRQTQPYGQRSLEPIGNAVERPEDRMFFTADEATFCHCGRQYETWTFQHPRTARCSAGHKAAFDPPKTYTYEMPLPEDYATPISVGGAHA